MGGCPGIGQTWSITSTLVSRPKAKWRATRMASSTISPSEKCFLSFSKMASSMAWWLVVKSSVYSMAAFSASEYRSLSRKFVMFSYSVSAGTCPVPDGNLVSSQTGQSLAMATR